jgi:hypothetical protein
VLAVVMNMSSQSPAYGVLVIHTCPNSLAKAVEWALQTEFQHFQVQWKTQILEPNSSRMSLTWNASLGTAARLASALIQIPNLRFEITEHCVAAQSNERFAFTPTLGIFRATIDQHGNSLFTENQLLELLSTNSSNPLKLPAAISGLIGAAWDEELDRYRIEAADEKPDWVRGVS